MRYIFQWSSNRITTQETLELSTVDSAMSHALSLLSIYRTSSVEITRSAGLNNIPDLIATVYAAAIK